VVPGDGLAQLGDARGDGVAERVAAAEQPDRLVDDRPRSAGRGLAGDHVDQVPVGALPVGGRRQQVHHVEGRHVRPLRHREPIPHAGDRVTARVRVGGTGASPIGSGLDDGGEEVA
jgi:hypothetical protein